MKLGLISSLAVVALWLVAACAPTAAPLPPVPAPAVVPASPALSPEAAAWAQVVEAAKKEGKVNIYSYNLVGDIGLAVSRAFKERYGITLDIITGRGAEFLERVKTEKRMGRLVADVHDGSPLHAANMKKEGLTIRLAEALPVVREQGVWRAEVFTLDDKDKHVAGFSTYYMSPWINTRLVTPEQTPRVWRDLLKPQWKGKMVLTDPTTSGGPQMYFVTLMRGGALDEDFVKALYAQGLRFASALPDEAGILARGERGLSIRGSLSVYGRFAAEGATIKAIDVQDGVVQIVSPIVVVFMGGPHPNASLLFVNWFFSKEAQAVYGRGASTTPIRSDVPDFAPEAGRFTPQKPITQSTEDTDKAAQLFRQRWPDKLWGRG